jgi:hypothetical protein
MFTPIWQQRKKPLFLIFPNTNCLLLLALLTNRVWSKSSKQNTKLASAKSHMNDLTKILIW